MTMTDSARAAGGIQNGDSFGNGWTDGSASTGVTTVSLPWLIEQRLHVTPDPNLTPTGEGAWHGPHLSRRRGQGLEFEDLRQYAEGDDIRHIDWKVSARRQYRYTRLYREERDHTVTLAVDLSANMLTGSRCLRSVQACRTAARLAWHGAQAGIRIAVAVQTEQQHHVTPAVGGTRGALACCRLLNECHSVALARAPSAMRPASSTASLPPASSTARATDLSTNRRAPDTLPESQRSRDSSTPGVNLLEQLQRQGRRAGTVVLVSGMDDADAAFDTRLQALSMARPLVGVLIEDDMERDGLPPGHYPYQLPDGVRQIRIDAPTALALQSLLRQTRDRLHQQFAQVGARLLTDRDEQHLFAIVGGVHR